MSPAPAASALPPDARGSAGALGKAARLRAKREFDRAYREGRRFSGRLFQIIVRANGGDHARLGLSVARRVGPAVVRNRWKRRLREAFRRSGELRMSGVDVVVGVKASSGQASFAEIERELRLGVGELVRRVVLR